MRWLIVLIVTTCLAAVLVYQGVPKMKFELVSVPIVSGRVFVDPKSEQEFFNALKAFADVHGMEFGLRTLPWGKHCYQFEMEHDQLIVEGISDPRQDGCIQFDYQYSIHRNYVRMPNMADDAKVKPAAQALFADFQAAMKGIARVTSTQP